MNKYCNRCLAFSMAVLLLLLCFSSCSKKEDDGQTSYLIDIPGNISYSPDAQSADNFHIFYKTESELSEYSKIYKYGDTESESNRTVICSEGRMTQLVLHRISFDENTGKFKRTSVLNIVAEILPGEALVIYETMPCAIPIYELEFVDSNNAYHCYRLNESSESGNPIFTEGD